MVPQGQKPDRCRNATWRGFKAAVALRGLRLSKSVSRKTVRAAPSGDHWKTPRATAAPDLLSWDPAEKSAFLEQLSCVNSEAIDLVGKITRSDPEAIIVLQSDHGTAFRGQFKKPFDAWNELDLKERFGALNTIRMPASCSNEAQGSIDLVNTFAHVLSCISGTSLPDKLARLFVVSHDGDMTNLHEYHRDF
jgi:hypothetical protein